MFAKTWGPDLPRRAMLITDLRHGFVILQLFPKLIQ